MITLGPKSGANGSTACGGAACAGTVVPVTVLSATIAVTIGATDRRIRTARR